MPSYHHNKAVNKQILTPRPNLPEQHMAQIPLSADTTRTVPTASTPTHATFNPTTTNTHHHLRQLRRANMARMKFTPQYSGPATDLQAQAHAHAQLPAQIGYVLQGNNKQNVALKRKNAPRDKAPSPSTAPEPTTKAKVQGWLKQDSAPDLGDTTSDEDGQDNDKENDSGDGRSRKISGTYNLAGCCKPRDERSDTPESEASTIVLPGKGPTNNPGDATQDEEGPWLDLGGADIHTSAEEASRSESEKTRFEMEVDDDVEEDVDQAETLVSASEAQCSAESSGSRSQSPAAVKQKAQDSQAAAVSTSIDALAPPTPSPPPRKRMRLADAIYDSPSNLNQPGRTVSPSTVLNYSHPLEPHEEIEAEAFDEITSLRKTLSSLKYDEDPSDRPYWIIEGINKPLPHPTLTSLQYQILLTKCYLEEIDRLGPIRKELMRNYNSNPSQNGGWYYEGWGETREAEKTWEDGVVLARGVWKLVDIEGEVKNCVLDEWPRDVWGERLGWTFVDGKVEVDEENKEKEKEKDNEDNEGEGLVKSFMTLGPFGRLQKWRMAMDSVSSEDDDAEDDDAEEEQEESDVDDGELADDEEEEDEMGEEAKVEEEDDGMGEDAV
ncbi:hypothetical protein BCR34DRAFT_657391 [Clohesyomyces aquaticus]|uniref:Uncharacterized protein n=1 Tax=Clohesyomyces aquaticus TaxID=1231657 RepID=A0A1Y1ZFU0_9PLEO|nr:hypothetical protein BCR34DRAFT_657391 [Clohesyomyces aquaticus]